MLLNLWRAFLKRLSDRQKVGWDEYLIDGIFVQAQNGIFWSRKLQSTRGAKLMKLADGADTPIGVSVEKASPAEAILVEVTLNNVRVVAGKRKQRKPARLIDD